MRLLDNLQRRFGRFAVPHVTEGLIVCQALTYFFCQSQPAFLARIALVPRRVLEGEVWRLVTFLCEPPLTDLLFAVFFWYLFYLMGTALENTWGTFRYNVYLLVGWLATAAVSFLQPDAAASPGFLARIGVSGLRLVVSRFRVAAVLHPAGEGEMAGAVAVAQLPLPVMFGNSMTQLLVLASVCNFVLFFWHDIWLRLRAGRTGAPVWARRCGASVGRPRLWPGKQSPAIYAWFPATLPAPAAGPSRSSRC